MSGQTRSRANSVQPAGEPPYRVAPGGSASDGFCVVAGTPDSPGSAKVVGFATREQAQAEADRLNALAEAFEAGGDERRDEVLGRMLSARNAG